jgi:hypothetical protein
MNPKFDINASDEDNDFESTHKELEAYVRGNQQTNAGLSRLMWERKVMRYIKNLNDRLSVVEDSQHSTVEIAAIAQKEVGPARTFVEAVIHWRRQIIKWAAIAAVTALVTWLLAKQGIKAT